MKVYGLTGLPGSGKSEIGRVARERGCPVIRMGDMVWDHVRELGQELKPDIVGRVAHDRREREGADIWAKVTGDHIRDLLKESSPDNVFIDGVRSMEEADRFHEEFVGFRIVAVHSSPTARYKRIVARKRIDDTISYEAFMEREKRELSWGISHLIVHAEIMIVNEGSMEDLRKRAEALIEF